MYMYDVRTLSKSIGTACKVLSNIVQMFKGCSESPYLNTKELILIILFIFLLGSSIHLKCCMLHTNLQVSITKKTDGMSVVKFFISYSL